VFFASVGAVDVGSARVGKDLGEFCGLGRLGVPISGSLDEADTGQVAAGGGGHDGQAAWRHSAAGGPVGQGKASGRLHV